MTCFSTYVFFICVLEKCYLSHNRHNPHILTLMNLIKRYHKYKQKEFTGWGHVVMHGQVITWGRLWATIWKVVRTALSCCMFLRIDPEFHINLPYHINKTLQPGRRAPNSYHISYINLWFLRHCFVEISYTFNSNYCLSVYFIGTLKYCSMFRHNPKFQFRLISEVFEAEISLWLVWSFESQKNHINNI